MPEPEAWLSLRDVVRRFPVPRGPWASRRWLTAVDHVSLDLRRGEAFGLVGASGSGKTTLGRLVVGLDRPDSGEIRIEGSPVGPPRSLAERRARWRRVQYVHQHPRAALNPRLRVGEIVGGALASLRGLGSEARAERVRWALEKVSLPADAADRHPHQFSGGQAQRIAIARALAVEPDLLVLDEPSSALDVRVQAELLALLADLRSELGTGLLFVSHDLAVVASLCDRVGVLEEGRLVEQGAREQVFERPAHPYTRRLLAAVPRLTAASAAHRV